MRGAHDVKLYTRKGDAGYTLFFGGQRVRKDDPRVQAYGTVDELNAVLGLAATACSNATLAARIQDVQGDLFCIGAELATPPEPAQTPAKIPTVNAEQTARIERWIDEVSATLPEIKTFILPCGSEAACRLHVARTVCRRTERMVVDLVASGNVRPEVSAYLNRLSDLLFAWARWANRLGGITETTWKRGVEE